MKNELRKILSSQLFWICVILYLLILILGNWADLPCHGLMADGTYQMGALYSLESTMFNMGILSISLIVSIPCAYTYLEEKGGYHYFSLSRTTEKRWLAGKILAAEISGVILVTVTLAVYTVFMILWYPAGIGQGMYTWEGTSYEALEQGGQYGLIYLIHCASVICTTLQWPMCSVCLSAFTENKYLVLAGPFLLNLLLAFVAETTQQFWISPSWTGTFSFNNQSAWGGWRHSLIYLVCFAGLWIVIFCWKVKRERIYG